MPYITPKHAIPNHSVLILDPHTGKRRSSSVSCDKEIWAEFKRCAARRQITLTKLVDLIHKSCGGKQISRHIRLFVFLDLKDRLGEGADLDKAVQPTTSPASVAA